MHGAGFKGLVFSTLMKRRKRRWRRAFGDRTQAGKGLWKAGVGFGGSWLLPYFFMYWMNIMPSLLWTWLSDRHRAMVDTEGWWGNLINMKSWVEEIRTSSQGKDYEGNEAGQHAIERAWKREWVTLGKILRRDLLERWHLTWDLSHQSYRTFEVAHREFPQKRNSSVAWPYCWMAQHTMADLLGQWHIRVGEQRWVFHGYGQ